MAEIRYSHVTDDGKLRQPVFLGLRDDKSPDQCTLEAEMPQKDIAEEPASGL